MHQFLIYTVIVINVVLLGVIIYSIRQLTRHQGKATGIACVAFFLGYQVMWLIYQTQL